MGYWKNKAMEDEADYEWARAFLCKLAHFKNARTMTGRISTVRKMSKTLIGVPMRR